MAQQNSHPNPRTYSATARQQDLLRFIIGYQAAHGGVSPSLAECAAALNLNRSNAARLLDCLVERGWCRKLARRARAIEVLHPLPIPRLGSVPLYAVTLPALERASA